MTSDNRAELFFVAEYARSKGPPINVRVISKIAGDDGNKIAEFIIEGYEATTIT